MSVYVQQKVPALKNKINKRPGLLHCFVRPTHHRYNKPVQSSFFIFFFIFFAGRFPRFDWRHHFTNAIPRIVTLEIRIHPVWGVTGIEEKKIQSSNGVTAKKNGSRTHSGSSHTFHLFWNTAETHLFFLRIVPLCTCVGSYINFQNSSFIHTYLSVYILDIYTTPTILFKRFPHVPICSSRYIMYFFIYALILDTKHFFAILFFVLVFFFYSSLRNYWSKQIYCT